MIRPCLTGFEIIFRKERTSGIGSNLCVWLEGARFGAQAGAGSAEFNQLMIAY